MSTAEDDALLAAVPAVSFEPGLGTAAPSQAGAGAAQPSRIDESAVPPTHDGVMNDDGSSESPLPTRQLTAFEMRNAQGAFVGICGTSESPTVAGSVSAEGLPDIPIALGQVIAPPACNPSSSAAVHPSRARPRTARDAHQPPSRHPARRAAPALPAFDPRVVASRPALRLPRLGCVASPPPARVGRAARLAPMPLHR